MQGKATLFGHPIHPVLVPLPIGFFVGALISDIISHWGDPAFWPRMSVVLIGLGVISALGAALFGFIDYYTAPLSRAAKKVGAAHMIFNLLLVAVFAIDFFVRLGDATSLLGYVLTVVGVILLGISGYLGGHLAYHYGIGVDASVIRPESLPR